MSQVTDFDAFLNATTDKFEETRRQFVATLVKAHLVDVPEERRMQFDNMPEKQWEEQWLALGSEKPRFDWVNPSQNKRSRAYLKLEGMKKAKGVVIKSYGDIPKYEGETFLVEEQTMKFGKNNSQESRPFFVILRVATEQDKEEYLAKRQASGSQPAAPAQATISEDEALRRLIGDGATAKEIRSRAAEDSDIVGTPLQGSLIDGTLLAQKVDEGVLEKDGTTYRFVGEAVTA